MAQQTLVVHGLKEMIVAAAVAGDAAKLEIRHALRDAGEIVRADSAHRLTTYSAKSAAGLKVRVRQRGVAVEQSLARTQGPRARKNYPGIQMHILATSLEENESRVEAQMEEALDELARVFEA